MDTGSFGVFMNGHRIATEKFSIQQNSTGSVATSEFKTEAGVAPAAQSSELQLAPNGDLRKYEWKEISPGKAQAVIVPNDNLLVERSTNNPQDKAGRASFPASDFDQRSGRLLFYPPGNSGLEISGHRLPSGQRTGQPARRTSR